MADQIKDDLCMLSTMHEQKQNTKRLKNPMKKKKKKPNNNDDEDDLEDLTEMAYRYHKKN